MISYWHPLQRQFLSVLCFVVLALAGTQRWATASPIGHGWIECTVRIENEWGGSGTGFLVFRNTVEKRGRIFLVTNKHVLNEDSEKRQIAKRLKLFVNVKRNDESVTGESIDLSLLEREQRVWREHSNTNVDVLAVDVTRLINSKPEMQRKWVPYSDFITPELRKKDDITIADEVLVIGYPDPLGTGLAHTRTNYPLVRQGIIASRIGEPITLTVVESPGKKQTVEVPGFLVDSTVIQGSSGSPVVLKPARGFNISDGVNKITAIPEKKPYLLGIVSATKRTALKLGKDKDGRDVYFPALAGLGVVYDAETIKQTIELFFK